MEWRYPRRNWQVVMGVDFYYRSITESTQILEARYQVGQTCLDEQFECPFVIGRNELSTHKATRAMVGGMPFLGVLFRVGRSVTLSAETGFQSRTEFGKYLDVGRNKVVTTKSSNGTNFNPLPIKELGIYYRF